MKQMLKMAWWPLPALAPALALAFSVAGCSLFGDDYAVDFETDQQEYAASTTTTISMTIENTGNNVVYYRCAGDMHIERFADGDLVDSFGGLPNCASLAPTPIESGETEDRDLTLDENVIKWLNEGFAIQGGAQEITYRLRLELFEDTEFMIELERDEERSNAFAFEFPTPE